MKNFGKISFYLKKRTFSISFMKSFIPPLILKAQKRQTTFENGRTRAIL